MLTITKINIVLNKLKLLFNKIIQINLFLTQNCKSAYWKLLVITLTTRKIVY